jgi:hypothetical protein
MRQKKEDSKCLVASWRIVMKMRARMENDTYGEI